MSARNANGRVVLIGPIQNVRTYPLGFTRYDPVYKAWTSAENPTRRMANHRLMVLVLDIADLFLIAVVN
jgi:hypothetical protein